MKKIVLLVLGTLVSGHMAQAMDQADPVILTLVKHLSKATCVDGVTLTRDDKLKGHVVRASMDDLLKSSNTLEILDSAFKSVNTTASVVQIPDSQVPVTDKFMTRGSYFEISTSEHSIRLTLTDGSNFLCRQLK